MLSVADIVVTARAPIVTVRARVVGELDAVRGVVTRVSPRVVYLVGFRVHDARAGLGCAVSANAPVRAGSGPRLRVALVPRGGWCAGVGVLSVVAVRRGGRPGTARLRVRPARALGQGDLVGRLSLGPTCPVERANDPCDPVARPAPVALVALNASGGEAAWTITLGDVQTRAGELHAACRARRRGVAEDRRYGCDRDRASDALRAPARHRGRRYRHPLTSARRTRVTTPGFVRRVSLRFGGRRATLA